MRDEHFIHAVLLYKTLGPSTTPRWPYFVSPRHCAMRVTLCMTSWRETPKVVQLLKKICTAYPEEAQHISHPHTSVN